jgi:DNA-binding response OmpR family regulator
MQQIHVLLLQSDPTIANTLANSLANSFHGVHVAKSLDELRHAAAKHQPFAIIVDLETATLGDVEALKQEFQQTRIVCHHRVADEEMWTRTLNVGADDCCRTSDMRGIILAAAPQKATFKHAAA